MASSKASTSKAQDSTAEEVQPFTSYELHEHLQTALAKLELTVPTPIQARVLPLALEGKDIIGLAQTGSGKTLAFALPILQSLLTNEDPKPFYGVVIAPTRELAYQIGQVFQSLGDGAGVRTCTIVGGMDTVQQAIMLAKKPHIIIATPGRLIDHLEHTKGFSLNQLKYLVLDEADRLLELDFGAELDKILKLLPRDRHTYLFSATMTSKVGKLQRASLQSPVKVEVSSKYSTVSTLQQYYILTPVNHKDLHLLYLLTSLTSHLIIIFTRTVADSQRLSILLRILSFPSIPLHGQLSQSSRLAALNKFKSAAAKGNKHILVCTDVAARGLDIPSVDYVINYSLPTNSKDYVHRVGRTARAGRSGKSITLVTQYDVEVFQRIEGVIGLKMEEWPGVKGADKKEEMMMLRERVEEASREAGRELREKGNEGHGGKRGRKRKGGEIWEDEDDKDRNDDEVEAGMSMSRARSKKRAKH
ncbi:DEAD-domain-containing protein, partial [Atractiella rhizophila]